MRRSDDLETGVLYCGDNLERLARLPSESVDLVYLDPPFFSNRDYEVIWGDEAEVRSFEDRWTGGMNYYVGWMRDRVAEMRRVLRSTGSLYLHCDPAASHYLKVMLDGVFGMDKFRNEVVWRRYGAHNDVGQGSRHWGRVHDALLFYANGARPTWNQVFTPLKPEYVRGTYRNVDPVTGRRFTTTPLTGPGGEEKGNPVYEWNGHTRAWRYSREKMERLEQEGRLHYSRTGYVRQKKYLDESKGVPVQDVWEDISSLSGSHAERLGYPTQKPLALLDRIIQASSNADDVVLDPFCGCGTTIAAAHGLNRRWVGIDISYTAVEIMRARLQKLGVESVKTVGMPENEEDLRKLKPFEFQNWVIRRVDGSHFPRKTGDMGIDGFSFLDRAPIQIKRSDRVGRPIVDNFETAVERYGMNRGYVVAFSFTRGAYEETARVRAAKGLEIDLVTVRDLLLGTSELVAPVLNRQVLELPKPRPKAAKPSVEELVESDKEAGEVA